MNSIEIFGLISVIETNRDVLTKESVNIESTR